MREIWSGRFRAPQQDDAGGRGLLLRPTDRAASGLDRRERTTFVPPAAGEPNLLGFQYVGLLPVLPSHAAGGTFDQGTNLFRQLFM